MGEHPPTVRMQTKPFSGVLERYLFNVILDLILYKYIFKSVKSFSYSINRRRIGNSDKVLA
jgi:hypothetical protein